MSLKAHRVNLGLTQAQVAEIMGTDQKTVSHHETGRSMPSGRWLQRYAELYRCDANDINLDAPRGLAA